MKKQQEKWYNCHTENRNRANLLKNKDAKL